MLVVVVVKSGWRRWWFKEAAEGVYRYRMSIGNMEFSFAIPNVFS